MVANGSPRKLGHDARSFRVGDMAMGTDGKTVYHVKMHGKRKRWAQVMYTGGKHSMFLRNAVVRAHITNKNPQCVCDNPRNTSHVVALYGETAVPFTPALAQHVGKNEIVTVLFENYMQQTQTTRLAALRRWKVSMDSRAKSLTYTDVDSGVVHVLGLDRGVFVSGASREAKTPVYIFVEHFDELHD